MKKNIKIFVFVALLICLISSILMLIYVRKQKTQKTCIDFELKDVMVQVNLATDNSFILLDFDISLYIPVIIPETDDYIFAYAGEHEQYFVLARDLNAEQVAQFENFVDTNNNLYPEKQLKIGKYDKYIYIISLGDYDSVIEGIIRSYIYC